MRTGYNTKQRDAILEFFHQHPHENFTAKDLIGLPDLPAGEATIYRNLVHLHKQGHLNRFVRTGGEGCFQFNPGRDCTSHFHLMCKFCGQVAHMDCGFADEMGRHLAADHGFQVDFSSTMIYGVCAKCAVIKEGKQDE